MLIVDAVDVVVAAVVAVGVETFVVVVDGFVAVAVELIVFFDVVVDFLRTFSITDVVFVVVVVFAAVSCDDELDDEPLASPSLDTLSSLLLFSSLSSLLSSSFSLLSLSSSIAIFDVFESAAKCAALCLRSSSCCRRRFTCRCYKQKSRVESNEQQRGFFLFNWSQFRRQRQRDAERRLHGVQREQCALHRRQ